MSAVLAEPVAEPAALRPRLAGWGRYPVVESELVRPLDAAALATLVRSRRGYVARGGGRAYGDAAIGSRVTLATGGLDRMRAFDPATGRLVVEAGVTLDDILASFMPRGFFPPVVPGTRHVTVGGMVAADVHGKNHHRDGGFGAHLDGLTILLPDGSRVSCSTTIRPELFAATIGGMGLTGIVLDATLRLRRVETGWIRQHTRAAPDLGALLAGLREAAGATYAVAWVDALASGQDLGRGLVYRGEHAAACEIGGRALFPVVPDARIGIPVECPSWTLNRAAVRGFNALYLHRGRARAGAPELVPWPAYFFPLDGLSGWNRLYGRRGFVQHQCVVPETGAEGVLAAILGRVARLGLASPLAVLKQLGPGSGHLSFPMPGYTLALDLPATGPALALLDEVDGLVREAGGRLYLAKDARQSRATFEAGYPALGAFRDLRRAIGAEGRVVSHLSARLGLP